MKEARLTIGERERHELQLHYSQTSRRIYVTVDGVRQAEIHMAWAGRHETNTRFVVGQSERHEVEVKVISGLFSAEIDVIVDGKLVFTL
jgi:hypothetical protein